MNDSHIGSTETQRNIIDYLKSLRPLPGDLEVEVKGAGRSGVLYLRQGQVIAAECGKLIGNGAFLTLASMGAGDVRCVRSEKAVESSVSVTVSQIERFFAKLPSVSRSENHRDEERLLQEAIQLFFQFRRKEAGAKLVEVLRSNRFYYPAWLWHSRLMTRENYIKKALGEARKWGNFDVSIEREAKKIESQLTGSPDTVRRCLFCWSLVRSGAEYCGMCRGLQRISKIEQGGQHATEELLHTLSLYEEESLKDPGNSRIAYCLCLGFCSLGKFDQAREYINKALKISPREPLFIKASALLQPLKKPVRQEPVPKETPALNAPLSGLGKGDSEQTILVVEDSKTARKVVSLVLGRKGYNIIEATSGTEALLAIEGVTPDLVLLDVMLPDMTGYEVLTAIRKSSGLSDVPVVMLTGKRAPGDRLKGMLSGSNEYLTKPFNPAKLLSVLGKYLEPSTKKITSPLPNYVKDVASPPPPVKLETEAVPKVTKPMQPKAVVTTATAAEIPKKKGSERSVLIVEDSPTSRKVISMVLSRKGYAVNEAATGVEALMKVEHEIPHLILLDAMLPDMTGYDILAKLKVNQRLKEIPVVMLTAKDSPVDREKGMRAGSVAYLTKPFNPDKLLSVIGSYI
ncbi:MAG: response regulator [Desulforhopalus sp.]